MTQAEIEAELTSLRARVSQLEQEREIKTKEWAKLAYVALWIAVGFLVYSIALVAIGMFSGRSPGPEALTPIYVIAPLAILIRVLSAPMDADKKPR
jgi:4-hydroxybenzoate polyprenyltransferase